MSYFTRFSPLYKLKKDVNVSRIVCWKCRRHNVTLRNLRNDEGQKTNDYACNMCWSFGRPPIGNSSQDFYKKGTCLQCKKLFEYVYSRVNKQNPYSGAYPVGDKGELICEHCNFRNKMLAIMGEMQKQNEQKK